MKYERRSIAQGGRREERKRPAEAEYSSPPARENTQRGQSSLATLSIDKSLVLTYGPAIPRPPSDEQRTWRYLGSPRPDCITAHDVEADVEPDEIGPA